MGKSELKQWAGKRRFDHGALLGGFQVILFVLRSKQQQPTLKRKTPRREGGAF